ncbi:MAG: hypothetical protein H6934_06245 [Burkholderiaceae bacterium]|nr:hypothetical protein [Burkholderiaceae bacterium]
MPSYESSALIAARLEAIWTVSVVEAARRFEWVARMPGIEMVADHEICADAPERKVESASGREWPHA